MTIFSQEAEKRQDSQPITVQISSRVVGFVPGGFLSTKAGMGDSSHSLDCPPSSKNEERPEKVLEEKEQIVNNVPLGSPEYYYFPPELVADARDFLEPKELTQFRPYGRGLANPGWNTCYFNSILQALTYAPYLSIDCLRKSHQ